LGRWAASGTVDLSGGFRWYRGLAVVKSLVHRFDGYPQISGGSPIGGLTGIGLKRAVAPRVGRNAT
jgi:hypothetical protein